MFLIPQSFEFQDILVVEKVLVTGNVVKAAPIVDTGTAEGRLARQPWRCKACGHGGALVHK